LMIRGFFPFKKSSSDTSCFLMPVLMERSDILGTFFLFVCYSALDKKVVVAKFGAASNTEKSTDLFLFDIFDFATVFLRYPVPYVSCIYVVPTTMVHICTRVLHSTTTFCLL
jgi:hypothetical protein